MNRLEEETTGFSLLESRRLFQLYPEPLRKRLTDRAESNSTSVSGLNATLTLFCNRDPAARGRLARSLPLMTQMERQVACERLSDMLGLLTLEEIRELQQYAQVEPELGRVFLRLVEEQSDDPEWSLLSIIAALQPPTWEDVLLRQYGKADRTDRKILTGWILRSEMLKTEWLPTIVDAISQSDDPREPTGLLCSFVNLGNEQELPLAKRTLLEFLIRTREDWPKELTAERIELWKVLCQAVNPSDARWVDEQYEREAAATRVPLIVAGFRLNRSTAKRILFEMLDRERSRNIALEFLADIFSNSMDEAVIKRLDQLADQVSADEERVRIVKLIWNIRGPAAYQSFLRISPLIAPELREQMRIDLGLAPKLKIQRHYLDSGWLPNDEYNRGLARAFSPFGVYGDPQLESIQAFRARHSEAWHLAFVSGRARLLDVRRGEGIQTLAWFIHRLAGISQGKITVQSLSERPDPAAPHAYRQVSFVSAGMGYELRCRIHRDVIDSRPLLQALNRDCERRMLTERFHPFDGGVNQLLVVFGPPTGVLGVAHEYDEEPLNGRHFVFGDSPE